MDLVAYMYPMDADEQSFIINRLLSKHPTPLPDFTKVVILYEHPFLPVEKEVTPHDILRRRG